VHPLFKEDDEAFEGPEPTEEFVRMVAVAVESEASTPTPSRYVRDPETGTIRSRR